MLKKPLCAISTCLLGKNVRYDGNHKLDRYVKDQLGQYVNFLPVCPEVECGMPTPRPALRLVDKEGDIRLMTRNEGEDKTPMMHAWMNGRLDELEKLPLCGFIFEGKSPTSGYKRVKIYSDNNTVKGKGNGMFAQAVIDRFPLLPVEDDGRLHDAKLRENFIERIFVVHRWNGIMENGQTLNAIMTFHARHKYLFMSHDPQVMKQMGKLLADASKDSTEAVYREYKKLMIPMLQKIATVRKHTNVLQHLMGYFKKNITQDEKAELLELIDKYYNHLVPLIVPITLINHYVRKYRPPYLLDQVYLNPHPMELMLRNHV